MYDEHVTYRWWHVMSYDMHVTYRWWHHGIDWVFWGWEYCLVPQQGRERDERRLLLLPHGPRLACLPPSAAVTLVLHTPTALRTLLCIINNTCFIQWNKNSIKNKISNFIKNKISIEVEFSYACAMLHRLTHSHYGKNKWLYKSYTKSKGQLTSKSWTIATNNKYHVSHVRVMWQPCDFILCVFPPHWHWKTHSLQAERKKQPMLNLMDNLVSFTINNIKIDFYYS